MNDKQYYSVRTGINKEAKGFNLHNIKGFFKNKFESLENDGYFQEYFGYDCVDNGFVAGKLGNNLRDTILMALRKNNLYPFSHNLYNYEEDDLFDVIEFLYDYTVRSQ
jgi:hypothetical protein